MHKSQINIITIDPTSRTLFCFSCYLLGPIGNLHSVINIPISTITPFILWILLTVFHLVIARLAFAIRNTPVLPTRITIHYSHESVYGNVFSSAKRQRYTKQKDTRRSRIEETIVIKNWCCSNSPNSCSSHNSGNI